MNGAYLAIGSIGLLTALAKREGPAELVVDSARTGGAFAAALTEAETVGAVEAGLEAEEAFGMLGALNRRYRVRRRTLEGARRTR